MLAAIIGLIGVVIGVVGTLFVSVLTTKATERQSREARREERQDRARELAATAYVSAVEAVAWLSSMHVEDSVDPQFMPEYEPKTVRAIDALHSARRDLTQVSALGGSRALAEVVPDVVIALGTLGDSWEQAQHYRRWQVSGRKSLINADEAFDREYKRMDAARERLCGRKTDLPSRETDEGLVLDGSLLGRLRAATAAT